VIRAALVLSLLLPACAQVPFIERGRLERQARYGEGERLGVETKIAIRGRCPGE